MNDTQHAAVWLSHNATYVVIIGAMCGVDEWLPPPSDAESLSDTDGGEREILEAEAIVDDDNIFGDTVVVAAGRAPDLSFEVSDVEVVAGGTITPSASAAATSPVRRLPQRLDRRAGAVKPARRPRDEALATGRPKQPAVRASEARPPTVCVESMLCVWGKPLKHPVPVHPLRIDDTGVKWIALSEHLLWLRRVCASEGSTHYEELFQSAVSSLRKDLKFAVEHGRAPGAAEQGKVRALLELDDDDQDPEHCKPAKRRKTTRAPTTTATVDGVQVTMKNSARPLLMECTAQSVAALMSFCQKHVRQGQATLKKDQGRPSATPGAASASWELPHTECPAIQGKVTWHPSVGSWAVHFKDASGKQQIHRLKVPASFDEGIVRAVNQADSSLHTRRDHYHVARLDAYHAAIKKWNSEDKSTRDRITTAAAA